MIPKRAQVASFWTSKSRSKMIRRRERGSHQNFGKFNCPPTSSALSASTWGGCVRVCVCVCVRIGIETEVALIMHRDHLF